MNPLSKYRVSLLAACFAIVSLAPAAHAQVGQTIAQVRVPFAFECGSVQYPAGLYNFRQWGGNVLQISGLSRSGFAMMDTATDAGAAEMGKAVFHVVGNRHFLTQIWNTGQSNHVVFFRSRAEQEIESASNSVHQPDIQLALLNAPR